MEIDKPVWRTKQSCPCCGQGGLAFSTCPGCGYMVLVCEEVDTVFPAKRDLSCAPIGGVEDAAFVCPGCHQVPVNEFRDSTADEIQQLGFQAGEYM